MSNAFSSWCLCVMCQEEVARNVDIETGSTEWPASGLEQSEQEKGRDQKNYAKKMGLLELICLRITGKGRAKQLLDNSPQPEDTEDHPWDTEETETLGGNPGTEGVHRPHLSGFWQFSLCGSGA